MRKLLLPFLFAISLYLPATVCAQIATWDFTGQNQLATSTANTYDAGLAAAPILTRGTTATPSAANNSFRTVGFKNEGISTSNTDYFQVTLTPAVGKQFSLTTIDAKFAGTAGFFATPGVTSQFAYSLDGNTFILIGSPVTSTSLTLGTINLAAVAALQNVAEGTTVTLRYYASGQTATGGWGFSSGSAGASGFAIGGTVTNAATSTPTINANPTTLAFGLQNVGSTTSQSYVLSGSNLTSNINVTALAPFTVSKNNLVYASSLSFSPAEIAASPTVYVNFTPTVSGSAISNITNSSSGATPIDIAVSGTGISGTVNASKTSLDFNTQNIGTNSTAQNYILSGTGLSNDVTVSTAAPFTVSKDNTTFTSSITYTTVEVATNPTVYVRFSPTSATIANDNILNVSTNAVSASVALTGTGTTPPAAPVHVVISEVYGGGGNAGATYKNDFIELYNPTNAVVDLTGWSIQYISATGTGNWTVTPLSGSIAPKSFYLVQEAAGANGTLNLPTPDKIGTLNLSGTTGKVLLSNLSTTQTGANPTGLAIVDKVGFGPTANGFEGTAPAVVITNTTSIERKASSTSTAISLGTGGTEEFAGNGFDSDENSTDFVARAPNPQNSTVTEPAPTSVPYLTITPTSLAFSNQAVGTTSTAKTYVLNGGNLNNPTTVSVSTPFTISKNNLVYSNSLSFSTAEIAANPTVYVNFTPTVAGNAAGSISNASIGATTINIALTGSGVDLNQAAFNFENCTIVGSPALSDGFYQYSVAGPQTWDCATTFGHDGTDPAGKASIGNALQINGFSSDNILNEDWLISPALNLSAMNYAVLSFWTRSAFAGDKLQLKVSTNYTGSGNPALATWTAIDGKFPETASDTWTKSDFIDLSAYKATPVYIAFVYNSTTSSASRWMVDDFAVTNSATAPLVDITASPGSLNFDFQAAGTTSTEKAFGFSAGNLTNDVTLTAPANFTISKTSGGTFGASLTYTKATINNTSQMVYAKFSPTTANSTYAGNVTITTTGSADKNVALSGNTFDVVNTLEVVNWNIEWFGSPAQDPSNDTQQATNVKTVVNSIGADIYGFAEAVDTTLFRNTVLPAGYNVIFSDFGSYVDNKADIDYPLAQKLAFMYRTDMIKPIRTYGVLQDTYNPAVAATSVDGTPYKNWSSGRFPFAMEAEVNINGKKDIVTFIEIHAKANTGSVANQIDAYNRRKDGNLQFKNWLDANLAGKKVIILGDFNDVLDPDKTIAPMPAGTGTSYSDFINDPTNYFPITLPLSLAGKQSTAGYPTVIDNVILTKALNVNYVPGTAEVLDAVKNLVTNYNTTTTDHYPIKSRYLFGNGEPTLAAIANQTICYNSANQTVALTGISAGAETTQTTTLMVTSDNANLFDILTVAPNGTDKGTITYHLKNNVSGVANITVTVTDNGNTDFGGINTTSKTFKLTVNGLATATIAGTTAVPANAIAPVITFTGANGTAPYTFTYNINGGTNKTVTTATGNNVTVAAPTNVVGTFAYNLVSIADANCGQVQTDTATITILPLPIATIASTAPVCINGTSPVVTFTGSAGTAPYTFTYTVSGSSNRTITSTANIATLNTPTTTAGTFTYALVSVADAYGNQAQTSTATVTINALPVINVASNNGVTIPKGTSVVLVANGAVDYTWLPSTAIIAGQGTASLTVRPKQTTTYTVTGTNASGCTSTQSITIQVSDDYQITTQNILTPNGDGKNDKFIIQNIDYYPNNTVKVFDRSGRIVYSKKGYDNQWDGTFNGIPLASDAYYYTIDFGANIDPFKGYITIIRN
ncbi:T9SS type B sorting domain-containing protein [Pedobacter sp. LMG 31464]|uniref:T9SS type B sorting domain-containing protein n=1 Tax=Pedobacter planticolens TaxID=2679964 RepID=A0A923DXE6_9SPHI|nr:gliding motility-associated C-terminal domain-containing protein [Pedobacter planticolens]MBB2144425.1 T9SS type B sorting domain-containing protein [Pedobacter planticolens]